MIRRFFPLLGLLALTGCAAKRVSLEGLRPRAAEAIDPRIPLPAEAVGKPVDRSLAGQVAAAEQRANAGVAAFYALLPQARAAAAGAGARGSEGWIVAQELLSALVSARAPVSLAMAEIDALGGQKVVAGGDVGVTDRDLLFAAAARLAAIDASQQAAIAGIRDSLAR